MHTIVFSDTHFTKRFNSGQFEALKRLVLLADRVIINGDFWEGLSISFSDFLNSPWNQLFPLLKQKHAVYIYGNHDDKVFNDERVSQFCDLAVDEYYLETPTQNYYLTHGQEFLFPQYFRDRHENHVKRARTLRMRLSNAKNSFLQGIIFPLFGPAILPKAFNRIPGHVRSRLGKPGYLLVCGHSHRPEFNPKNDFLDIGFFNYGWANYLKIDDQGGFKMVSERY